MGDNKNHREYSFKAIGETYDDYVALAAADLQPKPPIGIKTPFQLGDSLSFLKMHYDMHLVVADNLRNLILTNHGERIGLYDFGANLRPLTMELNQQIFDVEAGRRIAKTVGKYMSYVNLTNFVVYNLEQTAENFSHIGLRIEYTVPKINSDLKGVEVVLLIGG